MLTMMPTMMIAVRPRQLRGVPGRDVEVGIRRAGVGRLGGEAQRQRRGDQHAVRDVVSYLALGVVLQPVAAALAVHRLAPAELGEEFGGADELVDAVLAVDVRAAARDDDLAFTADYGVIAEKIVALIEGEPVNLVETLAERIAETCLADPAVRSVKITVHKPRAPIAVPFDDVSVTIVRGRSAVD